MRRRLMGSFTAVPFALVALLSASSSWAETLIDQKLDQVEAFDASVVLDMAFTDPNVTDAGVPDFENLGVNGGGGVASCKLAPRGLYCLATATDSAGPYQVVRLWKDPKAQPLVSSDLLRCDQLPNLAANASGRCVSLTVDLSGAIWVSATNGGSYSLFKVAAPPAASCPAPYNLSTAPPLGVWAPLTSPAGTNLCVARFAEGPGVLFDLNPVDGQDVAGSAVWPFGYGILALRNGVGSDGRPVSEALFFDLHAPTTTANPLDNFGSWGLGIGERLLSTSLLQVPQTGASLPPVKNYILATTNTRRIAARSVAATALSPTPDAGSSPAFNIAAWETLNPGPTSINIGHGDWAECSGRTSCDIRGTVLTATGGSFATKVALGDARGLGVNGSSGVVGEIDVNESVVVDFPAARKVSAIQILFLFNGPEFGDPREAVRITVAGGASYTLRTGIPDDGTAVWSGPGTVSKCGTMTSTGSGCFLISNPFPGPVKTLTFNAVDVTTASNDSDFSIGQIETASYVVRTSPTTGRTYLSNRDYQKVLALGNVPLAAPKLELDKSTKDGQPLALSTAPTFPDGITAAPGNRVDLTEDCPTPIDGSGNGGCVLVPAADGKAAAKFGKVSLASNSASGIEVFQVTDLPDCRYIPGVCYSLLFPTGPSAANAEAAERALITAGWILPLSSDPVTQLEAAAQLLNVTPLLPEDVTSKFDDGGVPPNGLPRLYVSNRYRAPDEYGHYFGGVFIKAQEGVKFVRTFDGEFDVDELNGDDVALGCVLPSGMNVLVDSLLEWDAITRVSETRLSVGGRYIDSLANVGCRNPTKIVSSETSFFPYLEIAPDTYGPTVRSTTPTVTTGNDGVFARLVQSLYADLNESRRTFACAKADGQLTNERQPISTTVCGNLAKLWSSGKQKLDKCVNAAFQPKASASNENCQSFRNQFDSYKATLPASPTGADPANRLGEQTWRWEVIKHVFETRFLPSIPKNGYCRERNAC